MIHALISYWSAKNARDKMVGLRELGARIFADSGAYSAFSCGARIKLAEYAAWLHRNKDLFDVYANLDVIGDPEKSARNQRALESEGLEPLPVFHMGSDVRHLDELLERYEYIGFGGMVPFIKRGRDRLWPTLVELFARIDQRAPHVRVHGFGVGSARLIKRYPWHSVDATTYCYANKTHQIIRYDGVRRKMSQVRPYEIEGRVGAALYFARKYGVRSADIVKRQYRNVSLRYVFAIAELVELEREIKRTRPGFRYYFGLAPNDTIPAFHEAFKLLEEYDGKIKAEEERRAAERADVGGGRVAAADGTALGTQPGAVQPARRDRRAAPEHREEPRRVRNRRPVRRPR